MTRKVWFTTCFLIPAFFLVTLGMRNPFLDHNQGPKPRPRAIIEEKEAFSQSQLADSDPCQLHADADVAPAVRVVASYGRIESLFTQSSCKKTDPVPNGVPSRASPFQPAPLA